MKPGRKEGVYAQYYKGKYILALYNFDDQLVQVFDNCHQLADWLGTTYDSVVSGVGRVLSGYCSYLLNKGNKYKVFAYEVMDDEKKSLQVNA